MSYPLLWQQFGWQAFIGIGLSIAQTASKGHDYGTALGVLSLSSTAPAQGTWNLFVALGSIAFAYAFVSSTSPLWYFKQRIVNSEHFCQMRIWWTSNLVSAARWDALFFIKNDQLIDWCLLSLPEAAGMQSIVLIEIQDTLASPPSEAQTMKKATSVGILIAVSSSNQLCQNLEVWAH